MCVCVSLCVCECHSAHTHTLAHTCMHARTHACTHACTHMHTHTHSDIHVHSHTDTDTQIQREVQDISHFLLEFNVQDFHQLPHMTHSIAFRCELYIIGYGLNTCYPLWVQLLRARVRLDLVLYHINCCLHNWGHLHFLQPFMVIRRLTLVSQLTMGYGVHNKERLNMTVLLS